MNATVHYNGNDYTINLNDPLDISLSLSPEAGHVLAWYLSPLTIEPVRMGDWVGEVKSGASVNFRNIFFNPQRVSDNSRTVFINSGGFDIRKTISCIRSESMTGIVKDYYIIFAGCQPVKGIDN